MLHPTLELLKKDHEKVKKLFDDLLEEKDSNEENSIAEKICKNLKIHMDVEELFLYPTIENVSSKGKEYIDEGQKEHNKVKSYIAQLESTQAGENEFIDILKQMLHEVEHHIQTEEDEVFPFAEQYIQDELLAIGAKIEAEKLKEKITM